MINWLTQLGRLVSPKIYILQIGNPEEPAYSSSPKASRLETQEELMFQSVSKGLEKI